MQPRSPTIDASSLVVHPIPRKEPDQGFHRVARFDPARGQLPESVTMDSQGNAYLTMSATVAKISPDGAFTKHAVLPLPPGALALGIKVGPDGCLYCASGDFSGDPAGAAIWRIVAGDRIERVAALDPAGFPNDLVFDRSGFMYVTEPFLGRIYRIDALGTVEVWLEHPLLLGNPASPALAVHAFGADGIVLDACEENLYVGNLDAGAIVRIPFASNRSAGVPEIFVQDARLKGADGLTFDRAGTLYVAVNGADRLVALDPSGALRVLGEGSPLDAPSSLVLGTLPGDEGTLYVACFAINRATGAHPGTPRPALLSMQV